MIAGRQGAKYDALGKVWFLVRGYRGNPVLLGYVRNGDGEFGGLFLEIVEGVEVVGRRERAEGLGGRRRRRPGKGDQGERLVLGRRSKLCSKPLLGGLSSPRGRV